MISHKRIDYKYLEAYDTIPMQVDVTSHYVLYKINGGLGGILLKDKAQVYAKSVLDANDKERII